MGRGPSKNPLGSRTDFEDLSVSVAGTPRLGRNGTDQHATGQTELAAQILQQRRIRLERQNRKLDLEIQRQEQQYGDIEQIRRDVRRANAVVKQSLYQMADRISEHLVMMDDPAEIEHLLWEQITDACHNLAFADGAGSRDRATTAARHERQESTEVRRRKQ
jgi:hypothetical protein